MRKNAKKWTRREWTKLDEAVDRIVILTTEFYRLKLTMESAVCSNVNRIESIIRLLGSQHNDRLRQIRKTVRESIADCRAGRKHARKS